MGSSIDTVQYVCDQAGLGRRLGYRRMFGEFAVYLDGKVIALVCDDQVFLKDTPEGRARLTTIRTAPPYPGARNFLLLVAELDDGEQLAELLQATARALPAPKPKAKTKTKTKARTRAAAAPRRTLGRKARGGPAARGK